VGDRLRSALVYEIERPRIEELIGTPDQKLQILKASVLSNGAPTKLVATSPELLVPPEDIFPIYSIITEHNPFMLEEDSSSYNGDNIDFTKIEDFFSLESKIDAKNDHLLLKTVLASPEDSFVQLILSNYTLPTEKLAFIQQYIQTHPSADSHVTTVVDPTDNGTKSLLISCQVCGEIFNLLQKFQYHILTHPDPENKKFLCQICGKRFNRADHLNRHSVLHGKVLHKCLLCGEEFDRASHLDRHRRKNHPPVGQLPSQTPPLTPQDKLPRLSSSSMDLESPMGGGTNLHLLASVATPEDIINSDNLNERANHSSKQQPQQSTKPPQSIDRPYVCDVCDRKFIRSTHLRRHMRIHTGEKPFCCHICGRRYARGDYLRAHINAHRRDRVHKCKHCNEIFHDLTRFADHCRQVHKDILEEGGAVGGDMQVTPTHDMDSFVIYDDMQLSSGLRLGGADKSKLSDDDVILTTRELAHSFAETDFLQAFVSPHPNHHHHHQSDDTHIVLQNGSLGFPDHSGQEVTILTNKGENILDPLVHLMITTTSETLEALNNDHTH
jgi:uncharacterized Zn-finger protein